jgi:hypothetical protein
VTFRRKPIQQERWYPADILHQFMDDLEKRWERNTQPEEVWVSEELYEVFRDEISKKLDEIGSYPRPTRVTRSDPGLLMCLGVRIRKIE